MTLIEVIETIELKSPCLNFNFGCMLCVKLLQACFDVEVG